jgi:hypothetical protein
VTAAKPGLAKLAAALTKAIPAVKHTTPLVKALRAYTTRSLAKTKTAGKLFTSLQQSGFSENFLGIVYYVTASLARYDSMSHLLAFALENIQNGACLTYATAPVPGCSANYGGTPASSVRPAHAASAGARASARLGSVTRASAPTASASHPAQPQATQTTTQPIAPPAPAQPTPSPPVTGTGQQAGNALQNLINYLLK